MGEGGPLPPPCPGGPGYAPIRLRNAPEFGFNFVDDFKCDFGTLFGSKYPPKIDQKSMLNHYFLRPMLDQLLTELFKAFVIVFQLHQMPRHPKLV